MPPKPPSHTFVLPPSFLLPPSLLPHICRRSIQSTFPPRPSRYARGPNLPILTSSTAAALTRKALTLPLRTGALAIKKGMTALYDPTTGKRTPCTVLQLDRVQVISHKTRQRHGYYAVQVGAGWKHPSNVTRPLLGHYAAQGTSPKRWVSEFRVRDEGGLLGVGEMISAGWFREGQFVDVRAKCRGMGFAGGMKRHGFSGQPASHGTSLTHRAMGSAGQSQGGGSRVLPGKKMPGRMGGQQVTTQNVKVLKVDEEKGIIVLNGSISGPDKCIVKLQDAIKKPWPDMPGTNPPSAGLVLEAMREVAEPARVAA
ncbi:MAG: 54S ribosomal protein L9, mitochondrial [Pycnora praestabilis]|nr:MAG: 54S ribosomal protein L9, mitochondrial [Pycnora praestabilis]